MPARSPQLRRASARAGAAVRWQGEDTRDARRDLAAERIAAYVERVLADAPPLDAEQKARLSLLLHGGAAA
jgi:hypothetical protein